MGISGVNEQGHLGTAQECAGRGGKIESGDWVRRTRHRRSQEPEQV